MHPVAGAVAKVITESGCGVGADGSLAENDFIDSARGDFDGACKLVLAEVFWSQVMIK